MSNTFPLTPPPPPPPVSFIVVQPPPPDPPSSSSSVASSFVIVVIIVASAVIASATIYILQRFLSRRFHGSFRTFATAEDVAVVPPPVQSSAPSALLDSLPLFPFNTVNGNLSGGDCAVCLSRFEPRDQLRLLPLCCHAFHAACIDAWIVANQTCPLCRSSVLASDSDILDKLAAAEDRPNGSFRVEIGSVSRRRDGVAAAAAADSGRQRSFSIGSFEYVLDGNGFEVPVGSTNNNSNNLGDDKELSFVEISMPAEAAAAPPRNWLREYVDRLGSVSISSRAMSFRSSGRFFSGSSRRSEVAVASEDLEANRAGEEISELFRWLSGI